MAVMVRFTKLVGGCSRLRLQAFLRALELAASILHF
jgi:hypothetical protein